MRNTIRASVSTVIFALTLLLAGPTAVASPAKAKAAKESSISKMTVYKSPTCGCCTKWIDHLKANGFEVTGVDMPDVSPIKKKHGVPKEKTSCHTGVVGKYVFEGHIPAETVKKFLANPPKGAKGLTVPGMPIGSPGMEGPDPERYEVLLIKASGQTEVFARH